MEQAAPRVEIELDLTCPECGHAFLAPFDATAFFLAEMRMSGERLLREVHQLAFHYGWSEAEILGPRAASAAAPTSPCSTTSCGGSEAEGPEMANYLAQQALAAHWQIRPERTPSRRTAGPETHNHVGTGQVEFDLHARRGLFHRRNEPTASSVLGVTQAAPAATPPPPPPRRGGRPPPGRPLRKPRACFWSGSSRRSSYHLGRSLDRRLATMVRSMRALQEGQVGTAVTTSPSVIHHRHSIR